MTRPISPTALRALAALAADPLARVHPATRAGLEARGLIEPGRVPNESGGWWIGYRVTRSGRALLEAEATS